MMFYFVNQFQLKKVIDFTKAQPPVALTIIYQYIAAGISPDDLIFVINKLNRLPTENDVTVINKYGIGFFGWCCDHCNKFVHYCTHNFSCN